ncbi:MAG TPA: haloalkane dehalogenase [Gammaproteobacteria bacterium]|nr:haloalkane dehalogenase [Gammaproteobacteria bacterium]
MVDDWQARKRYVEVAGQRMAYVEMGQGRPIVFQHGNPTSSYLWRNILPRLADRGRCIALDLIGMGDSAKLPDSGPARYTLAEHQRYFDGALAALDVGDDVVLVLHDWGTALGFDWAARHAQAVAGICHMEGLVTTVTWDEWPAAARGIFQAFRSPAGEELVLTKNVFVENVLPKSILRALTAEEMEAYRAPFRESGEGRRPTLSWPRQIPIEGEPAEVCETIARYAAWLAQSPVPKLFVNGDPGMIMTGRMRDLARAWPNTTEVTVKGLHFLQEDSPQEIADALRAWLPPVAGRG